MTEEIVPIQADPERESKPESAPSSKINVPILIASLLISIMLWGMVFTQNSTTMETSIQVRLTPRGLDDTKYVLMDYPANIPVTVSASPARLQQLTSPRIDPIGVIRLDNVHDGTLMVPVTLSPDELRQAAITSLPKVRVTVERLITKRVPVHIESKGRMPEVEDLTVSASTPAPLTVEVSGPQSEIDKVEEARGFLDLNGVDPSAFQPYDVQVLPWSSHGNLDNDKFRCEPGIVKVSPVFASNAQQKQVQVSVTTTGSPATGYGMSISIVNPPVVTASGTPEVLSGIQKLETDSIDVTGMRNDTTFTIPVRRPPGVRLVSPSTVRVRVNIRPMTKTGAR